MKSGQRRFSFLRNIFFSVLSIILFFGLIELVLTVFHVEPISDLALSEVLGAVKKERKTDGESWIFCFGGSTTYGYYYTPVSTFPRCLELGLKDVLPGKQVRVFNFGQPADDIRIVYRAIRSSLKFDPDLIIVYAGHNEFLPDNKSRIEERHETPSLHSFKDTLERSRTYRFLRYGIFKFRHEVLSKATNYKYLENEDNNSPEKRIVLPDSHLSEIIIDRYDMHLGLIIKLLQENDIPLILCTLPGNESGCIPFYSHHSEALSREQEEHWDKLTGEATSALARNQWETALEKFDQTLVISPGFAENLFHKGTCLLKLGRYDEAREAFLAARDHDGIPWRATSDITEVLKNCSEAENVYLSDVENTFRNHSPYGIIGADLVVDNCHPSIHGQYLIASALVETMAGNGLLFPRDTWLPDNLMSYEKYYDSLKLTPEYLADCEVAIGLYWLRLPAPHVTVAEKHLKKACELDPSNEEAATYHRQVLKRLNRFKKVVQTK